MPDVNPKRIVSSNEHGIVIGIRHAQDIDSSEGGLDWAEGSVQVRLLSQPEPHLADRRMVFRGRVRTPVGQISVGDTDGEVIVPAHQGLTELIVTVASGVAITDLSPEELRIDLLPAD